MTSVARTAAGCAALLVAFSAATLRAAESAGLPPILLSDGSRLVSVELSRHGCYGTCPVYTVTVHADGRVVFIGRSCVRERRRREGRIARERVAQLAAEVRRTNVSSLQDAYLRVEEVTDDGRRLIHMVDDAPSQVVTVTTDAWTKSIVDSLGAPPELGRLEERIDEVAGSRRWVEKRFGRWKFRSFRLHPGVGAPPWRKQ